MLSLVFLYLQMELQERIQKVLSYEKTKSKWRGNHNSIEFVEASKLNNDLFGMPLNRTKKCKCIEDLFYMIARMSTEKLNQIKSKTMAQFELKKDKLIMLHGMSQQISNKNLTDDIAISILTKYPSHIKTFDKFPANWEELCGRKPIEVSKPKKAETPIVLNENPTAKMDSKPYPKFEEDVIEPIDKFVPKDKNKPFKKK